VLDERVTNGNIIVAKRWAIAEGYIPGQSTGVGRQFESHETVCILNACNRDAHVTLTIYFKDRIAPHLSKALGATVVVGNQPGAGSLTALSRIYTAQPDGLSIMIVNGTAAGLSEIVGESTVQYQLGKFGYLGIVSASPWIWLVNPEKPVLGSNQVGSGRASGLPPGLSPWTERGIPECAAWTTASLSSGNNHVHA
jgi:hypothetical protein